MTTIIITPYDSVHYHQSVELRDAELRQPLGMRIRPVDVAPDVDHTHFAVIENDKAIACIIGAHKDEGIVKFRQMVVSKSHQGKGIGAEIVRFAEKWAKEQGYGSVTLNARTSAQGFYEKLGYTTYGERFHEIGVEHIEMRKTL